MSGFVMLSWIDLKLSLRNVTALRIARESLTEARRALWALRPEILESEPFPEALRRVVRCWSETSGIIAEAAVTGIPRALAAAVEVAMDVHDDGGGFDPATGHGGFGLLSMRERVQSAGGSLSVESAPGEGTTVAMQIPLGPHGGAEVSR